MKIKNVLISVLLIITFGGCATTGTGPSVEPEVAKKVEEVPDEPLDITFAGFAFLGDYSQKDFLYPYSSRIALEQEPGKLGQSKLNHKLFNAVRDEIRNPYMNLSPENADYKQGDTISLAFAVSTEKKRVQRFRGNYFVHHEVYAQIVVFDFEEMKIIATYPIRVQHSDFLNEEPSDDFSMDIFRKIYGLVPGMKNDIVKLWVKRMNEIRVKETFGDHIRIVEVVVPSETLNIVPAHLKKDGAFQKEAGQLLETFLSSNQSVPVVPYAEGGSLGAMRIRFSNSEIYSFTLPEADYGLYLKVRPFIKTVIDKKSFSQVAYGSFIDLKLRHVDLDETYMNASFRNVPTTELDKSAGTQLNDWDEFQKSIQNLFNKFTKQLSIMDSDYFNETTRTENIKSQFQKFMNIINKVR